MTATAVFRPRSVDEVSGLLAGGGKFLPIGAETKPGLSSGSNEYGRISLAGCAGILEYDPGEFTFTALAGTRLTDIQSALARNGQYLPFDPPLASEGATLGGTIAAGLSGPGRVRYGGVRDFILGVRFVTGAGEVVRGGGKVVKNAAGFDFPKLMVGSLGRLGVIVEATFKVFPRPLAYATLKMDCGKLPSACEMMARLSTAPFDFEGIELQPPGQIWLRLGGAEATLGERVKKLEKFVAVSGEQLEGQQDAAFWSAAPWAGLEKNAVARRSTATLVKVPLTLSSLPAFDEAMAKHNAGRRYSAGGVLGWIAWNEPWEDLDGLLRSQGLAGLVIFGDSPRPLLGAVPSNAFRSRIKAALDPSGRFLDL
jgi:glycolate oxidase FAD binding subunit